MILKKSNTNLLFLFVGLAILSACVKNDQEVFTTHSNTARAFPKLLMANSATINKLSGSGLMLGINGHPLGDEPYIVTGATKQIKLLNDMGMNWYRINVQSQSDGTMSASALFDALQKAATNGNVNLLPMLYPRTLNHSNTQSQSYAAGFKLGSNFAARYGKYFSYYDLGNDLELELLLQGKTGQSQFHYDRKNFNITAAYLKGMDEGIKSKDPGAKTMISAGWLHYGFLRMCDWYGVKFDVVAYHWYSDMEGAAGKSPYNIPDITVKLAALFPKKDIWFTEVNYRYNPTNTEYESKQSAFIHNFIAKCKNNPQVKVMLIYELFNEPYKSVQEGNFGIFKWKVPYTIWSKKLIADQLMLEN